MRDEAALERRASRRRGLAPATARVARVEECEAVVGTVRRAPVSRLET